MAFCSKSTLALVTYEQAVRAFCMAGPEQRRTMKRLSGLIEKRRIFTPSVARLLRLGVSSGSEDRQNERGYYGCEVCGTSQVYRGVSLTIGVVCCQPCNYEGFTSTNEYPHERLATSIQVAYCGDYKFITYDVGHRGQPYRTRDGEWRGQSSCPPIWRRRGPTWSPIAPGMANGGANPRVLRYGDGGVQLGSRLTPARCS
jgi:hypothetical protein